MKKIVLLSVLGAALMVACQTTPVVKPPSQTLGILEVSLNANGSSTARLESGLKTQGVTLREADVVFGTGTTQVISSTESVFDFLVATFPVSHASSSTEALNNLTLYALAKENNISGTAIKSITNFGGVTGSEQTRLAKLLIPTHAVLALNGNIITDNAKADFQAFTATQVSQATLAASTVLTGTDTILNYGFSARCSTSCVANSRTIATNATGTISIAIRVPKAELNSTYGFVMNFVVMTESEAQITRGVIPFESLLFAQIRGASVGATGLTQIGLANRETSTILSNEFVNDVNTSTLWTSINALGINRISAGTNHTCGLDSSGAAFCWGKGEDFGQLGNNGGRNESSPVVVSPPRINGSPQTTPVIFSSISAGNDFTCGVAINGVGFCWGKNIGTLGDNSTNNTGIPVNIAPPTDGTTLTFSSISAGDSHACGITTDGVAYCWGFGFNGRLGNNSAAATASLVPVAVKKDDGTDSLLRFSSISAGNQHTCGITKTNLAFCWGLNQKGQLGNNSTETALVPVAVPAPVSNGSQLKFISISAGFEHTCAVTSIQTGYCWGADTQKLGTDPTGNNLIPGEVVAPSGGTTLLFSSIQAGQGHTCGITQSGAGFCWGSNPSGQLGRTSNATAIPVAVFAPVGGTISVFSSINSTSNHTCGLTSNGNALCWGEGSFGQIGNTAPSDVARPNPVNNTDYKL